MICPKMESVAWKNITVGVCWDLMCRISGMSFFWQKLPHPPEGINSLFGHTHVSMPPLPPIEGLNFVLWPHPNRPEVPGDTSAGKLPSKSGCIRLHVVGTPCWLGTLPSVLLGVRNT